MPSSSTGCRTSPREVRRPLGPWIAIGIGIGVALGVAANNVGLGILVGLAIGIALGISQSGRRPPR